MVQKLKVAELKKFYTKGGQNLLSLPGTREFFFSFHFKHYNLTICTVNFFETSCTCSPSSLRQDHTVKLPIFFVLFYFLILFLLLELEMADLIFY
jgi:hypothetical protein